MHPLGRSPPVTKSPKLLCPPRLQERAEGGQVLISGATHELVRDAVTAEPLGPLTLHNRRDPIDGWLLQTLA